MYGIISLTLGVMVFMIGLFFVAKAQGQRECVPESETRYTNEVGGGFGLTFGIILLILGCILGSGKKNINVYDTSSM